MPIPKNPEHRSESRANEPDKRNDNDDQPSTKALPTTDRYLVMELVDERFLAHGVHDTADAANTDVVNRRKVGGARALFMLTVQSVNEDDTSGGIDPPVEESGRGNR